MTKEERKTIISTLSQCCKSPGEFITKVMAVDGITQKQLAQKMNTSVPYITMNANGYNVLSYKAALKFAKALDVDPFILNRLGADVKLREYLQQKELEEHLNKVIAKSKTKMKTTKVLHGLADAVYNTAYKKTKKAS